VNNKSINEELSVNEAYLKKTIGESFDTKYRNLKIPAFNNSEALIVYISGMIDARVVDETILEPLMKCSNLPESKIHIKSAEYISVLMEKTVFTAAVKETKLWKEICDGILEGDTVLFIDQCETALILTTRKYAERAITEPETESEIRSPRDGFTENIQTNASLIRRRIKDYSLRFDNRILGERSKTAVSVVYIGNLVDGSLLNEVKSRLDRIKIDAILGSAVIEEMIEDAPFSLFPKLANTERPDKVCAALLEGRVAILIDNEPFALVLPVVFWQFFASGGDYYERYFYATFIRWIRYIALFFSVSASSIYVLLTSFHQEMLPTALALKIAEGRSGVPFPAVAEAFIMEIIMEIMKEAGLRMPSKFGQTVSIVGTLVLGQAAVTAGLVGPLLLIVIAVAAISSFAISAYTMSNALRIIRFPLLFLTAFLGVFGFLGGIIIIFLHLMSLRSFGSAYLAPVIPFEKSGSKDVFIRAPWWKMTNRPGFVKSKDSKRQAANLKPKPPSKQ
jgi:spore germination protein KA